MLFMWLIYVILSTLAICGVMLSSVRDTGGLLRSVLPQDTRKKDFNEVVRPIWRIPELANRVRTSGNWIEWSRGVQDIFGKLQSWADVQVLDCLPHGALEGEVGLSQ